MIPKDSYSYASGDLACSVAHPFDKAARSKCIKASNEVKTTQAQADATLAAAALAKASQVQQEDKWSPLAITGVVIGSLAAITIMVVVIKRIKAKKA